MDVELLAIDDPRWPDALRRLRHDFYHLPEYVRLDGEWNRAQPMAFLARSGDEELFIPYLLRRCEVEEVYDVVSPYGYPGLLLSDAARRSPRFAREAMRRLSETLREMGACSAFFRMHPLLSDGLSDLFPEGFFTPAGETVAMDLTLDEGGLWKGIREGHQWTIKKCRRLGFVARMVSLRAYVECVMEIYRETMDRVQAKELYYFGRDYFARLAEMPGQVHCAVVELEGQPAAACIFFECDGIVQAHLGGTRSEFLHKSPFHLLLYSAAEWARSRGNRYLHMGGGVGGSNDRLLQFKRGFSPLRFPFSTLRLVT
ncbi:MAG TPA: GNAT family N-acetyltransferase, partial [Candidatus Dormibacteraeota bacterium]|nr:GNAT family N-acetyltransferase [Candidatus Dormibacteraeota bacterium]